MNPRHARTLLLLSTLILIGLGARVLGLGLQPLWWDEGYSLYFATERPARLVQLTALDIHPPLYYLLLQAWLALVGIGAVAARWFSVLMGVATLPVMWWVARMLAGRRVAWLATLLLALAPLHVYYSQEVRMYGLVTLLALLAVGAWRRRAWWALGVVAVMGLLAHYYFALLLLALALLVLWEVRAGQTTLRGPLRSLAVVAVGYLPWMVYAGLALARYVGGKLEVEGDAPLSPVQFLPRHLIAWSVGHLSAGWEWLIGAALLFGGLALLGLYWRDPGARAGGSQTRPYGPAPTESSLQSTLAVLVLVPTLGTFLINLAAPFVDPRIERQLLFVLPFFLIMVARGVEALARRWSWSLVPVMTLLVAFSLTSLWGFYTVPRYPGEDYRPLLARVGAEQGPGDGWLAIYPWQIGFLRAYLPRAHPTPIAADLAWAEDGAALEAGARDLLAEHPRLWFPAYQVRGRLFEEEMAQALNGAGVQAWNEWDGNTRLYLFGSAPEVPSLQAIGTFQEAGEARAVLAVTQAPGGVGVLPIFFEVEGTPEGMRASIQLAGQGSVWGEWDGEVTEGLVRAGLPVAHGTPPGEYAVQLTLYREESGQTLDRFENGERVAPEASLGNVSVVRPMGPLPAEALRRAATMPADVRLGESLRFLGASVPDGQWLQGERVPVTLFWQALGSVEADLNVFVQALDAEGQVQAARDLPPVNGTFPTSQWQAGDLVRDPHTLDLPAEMPVGEYRLVAGFYDPATGTRLAAPGGQDAVELGTLRVEERERVLEEPIVGNPTDVPFGTRARLARVLVPQRLPSGGPLEVVLIWQATEAGGSPLKVFVHLYRDGEQIAVSDHVTGPPATAWVPGEWMLDPHRLDVPLNLPEGEYRLVVGLYDPETGARLPTPEGDWATIATWTLLAQ
jgi:hypothetical protein